MRHTERMMEYVVINKGDESPIAVFYNEGDAITFCRTVPNTEYFYLDYRQTSTAYMMVDASAYFQRPVREARAEIVVGGCVYRAAPTVLNVIATSNIASHETL